jgi:NADH-quinone oxidoreductase subunit N
MSLGSVESLAYFYPEGILALTIVVIFIADLLVEDKEQLGNLALIGVTLALVFTSGLSFFGWQPIAGLGCGSGGCWLFHRMMVVDNFAVFFKVLLALSAVGAVWMSLGSNEVRGPNQGEYYGILLGSTLGMFFMASAVNLLMAYMALEFVSLTSYVLTGYLRHNRRSGEAALKYLIYGGVASGAMIYGMSWIFGLTGSMDYAEINAALQQGEQNQLALLIALILIFAGFGYKISAVPFHMWAPDVYHGAPIPITAFLTVGSKAAGFALLMRFFYPALAKEGADGAWQSLAGVDWPQLMLVISMATMTLGNLAALNQQNVKRLLAYSSIAHAGYTLMGFVVLSNEGLRAMLFYLVVYYLMNLGAFLVVMVVANNTGREDLEGFRGLAWRGGAMPAIAMAIFLFSLTGMPPFAGFIGKFYLFAAVVKEQFYYLAVVGILNSVVSLYYYVRIIKTMFLDTPQGTDGVVTLDAHNGSLLAFLSVATVILGLYWAPVFDFADRSVRFFVG